VGKRVVFHTASLRGGGSERVFTLMANALAGRGHKVTLFTWNADGPNATLLSPAVSLVSLDLPIHGEGYGKIGTIRGIFQSALFFRRHRPDAVFSAPEFANLAISMALRLSASRARFFPSFHAAAGLPSTTFGANLAVTLSDLVRSRASKAIAVSQGIGQDLEARGFDRQRVAIINNPLPPKQTKPSVDDRWQTDLAAMGKATVIATAGRLVPVKDHKTLIAAFARLRQTHEARLVIFGEGPLAADLRNQADALGIGQSVLLPGYVNDLTDCYKAADMFVLSSTSEGFGNVLIEAMAEGVPVISTDAPYGPREILGDGLYGALVPVGDTQALAKAMASMMDRPTDRQALRQRAKDFDIDLIADRYEALLS
jgi:glycosyltransferase involved in cell wall biosynthesis